MAMPWEEAQKVLGTGTRTFATQTPEQESQNQSNMMPWEEAEQRLGAKELPEVTVSAGKEDPMEQPSGFDKVLNALKAFPTSWASLGNLLQAGILTQPELIGKLGEVTRGEKKVEDVAKELDFMNRMQQGQKSIVDPVSSATGFDPKMSEGSVPLRALEAAADPLNVLGGTGIVARMFGVASGAGAGAASEFARQKGAGAGGQALAALAGGMAPIASGSIARGATSAYNQFKNSENITEFMAARGLNNLLGNILEENPEFLKDLNSIQANIDSVKGFKDLGLENKLQNVSPFIYGALKSETGARALEQASSNPLFKGKIRREINAIKDVSNDLVKAYDKRLGGRELPTQPSDFKQTSEVFKRRITSTEKAIEDAVSKLRGMEANSEALGSEITSAVMAKEKEVRGLYNNLYNSLGSASVEMPSNVVSEMTQGFKREVLEDMFGTGNSQIQGIATKLYDLGSLDAKEMLSLKNALNKLRTSPDGNIARKASDLKARFDVAVEKTDPEWAKKLAEVDAAYRKDVGIDINDAATIEGIKASASKYASTAAKRLLVAPEAFDELSNVVGSQAAEQFVKKAFLNDIVDKVGFSGDASFRGASALLQRRQARELLDKVPNVRDELLQLVNNPIELNRQLAEINRQADEYAKRVSQGYFEAIDKNGIDAVVDGLVGKSSQRELRNLFETMDKDLDAGGKDIVLSALRTNMAERLVDKGGKFFYDNKEVFEKVYSKQHVQGLEAIGKLMDDSKAMGEILRRAQSPRLDQDPAKQLIGVDIPYLASQLRDRISSVPQKLIRIGTKISTNRVREKEDRLLQELFEDPKAVEKIRRLSEQKMADKLPTDKWLEGFTDVVNSLAARSTYQATKQAAQNRPAEESPVDADFQDVLRRRGM